MEQLEVIRSMIHVIRGQRVMLDSDLAELYGVETKALKRSVKRNMSRFDGDDFMFELTYDEFLRCKIGTSNGRGGTRYMPYAFTELGVAMLSSVLRSETAIEINRGIMRAFVAVRQMLANPILNSKAQLQVEVQKLREYIEDVLIDQNEINEDTTMRLELIEQSLAELRGAESRSLKTRPKIGFNI
ncbi:MAG: ORF6N domain-containing protein [Muribaculaceae bacterium]|nr:ORF6N domain-containing protein [Muribaculaceae bacterium]